ncbi:MAG TPA: hypothetical protein PK175_11035 [Syntrophales bacterium]|jgi:methyl-accepting chemotaxis protein|nr:hypothetical protein [Syntrophales bacterium]HON23898.1 hypothetical protein [Syntrophales bacterium]HOU78682.1 hypothetical protein [Syntrophales bacterium]HPC33327.1 hypothetical protein [Syntrophales bacterium]HQG35399.1 hypothetical protein [Syntrophales bacterium]
MTPHKQRKLTNYLVDRDLQIRVLVYALFYMIAVVMITVAVLLFPTIRGMDLSDNQAVSYYAAQTFIMVTTKVIPAVALIVVLYALHLIIITHRICGPLVNFSHAFRRVGEGDLRQRIKLRQGDYLKKECDRINDMIRDLSLMVTEAKQIHERLARDAARLTELCGKDKGGEGFSSGMALLEGHIREMGQTLSRFKTGDEGADGH